MTRLPTRKLAALNLAVQEVYAAAWKAKLIEALPHVLGRVVSGELAIGSLLTPAGAITYAATNPVLPDFPEIAAGYARWGDQHPTLGRRPEAQSISEHISQRAWQRTTLYAEVMRDMELQDDVGLDVPLDSGLKISFCMWRGGWTFQQEDRALLDLLGPHVRQAWGQNERMKRSAFTEGFPEPLENALGHGVIRVDARGRVLEWSAKTRAQLASFTGVSRRITHLPPSVMAWFREQGRRLRQTQPVENRHPILRLTREDTTLDIQFVVDSTRGHCYLVLEEKPAAAHPNLLRPLGLSTREQEVLFWIAQGKANQPIAQILGISIHTVKRHLEKIYAKLELDGRHAASNFAQEYLHRAQSPD